MENVANVDLKFLRNEAEYFCIQGLVKLVDEEIEKTEKREALRFEQLKRIDENVTKIGQMKRIDDNVTKLGSTIDSVIVSFDWSKSDNRMIRVWKETNEH